MRNVETIRREIETLNRELDAAKERERQLACIESRANRIARAEQWLRDAIARRADSVTYLQKRLHAAENFVLGCYDDRVYWSQKVELIKRLIAEEISKLAPPPAPEVPPALMLRELCAYRREDGLAAAYRHVSAHDLGRLFARLDNSGQASFFSGVADEVKRWENVHDGGENWLACFAGQMDAAASAGDCAVQQVMAVLGLAARYRLLKDGNPLSWHTAELRAKQALPDCPEPLR